MMRLLSAALLSALVALAPAGAAALQATQASGTTQAEAPQKDTSYIDADGTAHITRVIPVPKTISPEAQRRLGRQVSDAAVPETLAERRAKTDAYQVKNAEAWKKLCPVNVEESTMAGVPVHVVTPLTTPEGNRDRVLLNLHGGGFNSDSGSLNESIPIAYLTRTKVVAALYRLAPEHPFPAAVDDSVAIYKELLKTYKPEHIAIYGTSAGAILTAEVAVKLKELHLPMPAALGVFSGMGDFSRDGDSWAMYALGGLSGHLDAPKPGSHDTQYVGSTDARDPVLSPVFADLHGLPPSLFITSGRDILLSGTTILHRAFLRAGDDARLVVFEGLTHAFWYDPTLPETNEANGIMAGFFEKQLGEAAGGN
ncbi:alpha/beta hydrolase fold domain-containing protein [Paracidobacterium acidisoli]|uniref:Alpha/beta hydrolase n=1 Tax=Paracidobacterium acidisoli TaxID=2303751 RepID=A0A372IM81_9BACT|nr:alpha/beta hydrolase fold domain-containing protein [Paracidobacterium acidisoli]MBT9332465.1 alpha/beta hydrolase [Paracidobacterium acidisoli]